MDLELTFMVWYVWMRGARCETCGVEIRWFPATWRRGVTTTSAEGPVQHALDNQLVMQTMPYTHHEGTRRKSWCPLGAYILFHSHLIIPTYQFQDCASMDMELTFMVWYVWMRGARCETCGVEIRWFPVTWRNHDVDFTLATLHLSSRGQFRVLQAFGTCTCINEASLLLLRGQLILLVLRLPNYVPFTSHNPNISTS